MNTPEALLNIPTETLVIAIPLFALVMMFVLIVWSAHTLRRIKTQLVQQHRGLVAIHKELVTVHKGLTTFMEPLPLKQPAPAHGRLGEVWVGPGNNGRNPSWLFPMKKENIGE